jgi:hypothetical protein
MRSPNDHGLAIRDNERLAAVDLALGVDAPSLGVFLADERLAEVASLAADLYAPSTGFLFADGGHFRVQIRCNEVSGRGENGR